MAFDFTGKRVLITGAGRGIGRALSIALHNYGCHVFAVSRTESTLVSLKEECPNITTLVMDITHLEEMERVFEGIDAMDGIVNNALATHIQPSLDVKKKQFDHVINTNVWAAIRIIQIFAKKMIAAKKKGSIVNVSSILSKEAHVNAIPYNTSKAALDMVSKQFALELGPHDIRVNSINPSLIMTGLVKKYIDEGLLKTDEFLSRTPRGRLADIEEAVHPIMYLLSEYSSAVTGSTHIVDCGLLSTFKAPELSEGIS